MLEQLAEVSQDAAKLNEWVSQLDDLYDKLQCVDRGKVEEVKESLEDVARAASQQSPGDVVGACLGLCHNVIEWLSGCTLTGKYATALMLLANEYCGPFSSLCERHI